jgi:Protein kinase domain
VFGWVTKRQLVDESKAPANKAPLLALPVSTVCCYSAFVGCSFLTRLFGVPFIHSSIRPSHIRSITHSHNNDTTGIAEETEKAVAAPRPTHRTSSTVVETSLGPSKTQQQQQQPKQDDSTKPAKRMDDSAHTFAACNAGPSISGHHSITTRHPPPETMITDALSDVRVQYHIEAKELGHGHYGIVRKCMHRTTGDLYAIKSIRKSKVSKIEVLKREIEILKEVDHPNIIKLKEVYEDERYLHLVTELCTGGELFDRIIAKTQSVEGHFSEHDAALLVRDILDAIRYCHDEKGIVHRGTFVLLSIYIGPTQLKFHQTSSQRTFYF